MKNPSNGDRKQKNSSIFVGIGNLKRLENLKIEGVNLRLVLVSFIVSQKIIDMRNSSPKTKCMSLPSEIWANMSFADRLTWQLTERMDFFVGPVHMHKNGSLLKYHLRSVDINSVCLFIYKRLEVSSKGWYRCYNSWTTQHLFITWSLVLQLFYVYLVRGHLSLRCTFNLAKKL